MALGSWKMALSAGLAGLMLSGCVAESGGRGDGYRRPAVYATGVYYERDRDERWRPGPDRWDRQRHDRDGPNWREAGPRDERGRPDRGGRDSRADARCMGWPECRVNDRRGPGDDNDPRHMGERDRRDPR